MLTAKKLPKYKTQQLHYPSPWKVPRSEVIEYINTAASKRLSRNRIIFFSEKKGRSRILNSISQDIAIPFTYSRQYLSLIASLNISIAAPISSAPSAAPPSTQGYTSAFYLSPPKRRILQTTFLNPQETYQKTCRQSTNTALRLPPLPQTQGIPSQTSSMLPRHQRTGLW